METTRLAFLIALAGLLVLSCSSGGPAPATPSPAEDDVHLALPAGFQVNVVADNLGTARHLVVRENGDIYVALEELRDGAGIVALRDTNGDGVADVIRRFGGFSGTGIDIHDGHLYFASDSAVYRYRLPEIEMVPEAPPELIIDGFPEQNQHASKPFAFDEEGNIYVNVGAPSNACQEKDRTRGVAGLDPCPQLQFQAGIWRFNADRPGQTQQKDGLRYATGIRNSVAITWNPSVGELFVVQHGRDQLSQLWPDLFTDEQNAELPAEEFLLAGEGSDFGWPYCYYDQIRKRRVLAPEYGGDGREMGRCAQLADPVVAFPGHWAPNDLLFYGGEQFPERYRHGAFITFHGSWNRAPLPQAGFLVAFVPMEGAVPIGDWEVFADGFAGTESVRGPNDAKHRPMGLAEGPDGSLFISDSRTGRIWRVRYAS